VVTKYITSINIKGLYIFPRDSLLCILIIYVIKEITFLNDINPLALRNEGHWVNMANVRERN